MNFTIVYIHNLIILYLYITYFIYLNISILNLFSILHMNFFRFDFFLYENEMNVLYYEFLKNVQTYVVHAQSHVDFFWINK